MTSIHKSIDEDRLEQASELMRALSHELRLRILDFIDKNDQINVNKIYINLGLEQSITSQHLRILRLADLVRTRRDGKQIFYTLNSEHIELIGVAISEYMAEINTVE